MVVPRLIDLNDMYSSFLQWIVYSKWIKKTQTTLNGRRTFYLKNIECSLSFYQHQNILKVTQ